MSNSIDTVTDLIKALEKERAALKTERKRLQTVTASLASARDACEHERMRALSEKKQAQALSEKLAESVRFMGQARAVFDGFDDVADIEAQWAGSGALDGCIVLLASYTLGDYTGDAECLFWNIKEEKLFRAIAGHCSCNGLDEEPWEPEEVTGDDAMFFIRCYLFACGQGEQAARKNIIAEA